MVATREGRIQNALYEMEVKEENIIFINLFENARIEIPEVDEMHTYFNELVKGQPCYLVVTPAVGNTSSPEARKHATEMKGKNVIAEALIITNLAIRLLANFYIKVNRPDQKVKIFSNSISALNWIHTLKAMREHPLS